MGYATIAAGIFAGDFFMKKRMEDRLGEGEKREACGGKILLRKYHNNGAALNFMEKRPKVLKVFCGCLMLTLGILWFLLWKKKENPGILLGMSLILGGGASNLFDRLTKGHVIDYFSFKTPWTRLNRIVFNLSDMFIFLGSLLVVLFGVRK